MKNKKLTNLVLRSEYTVVNIIAADTVVYSTNNISVKWLKVRISSCAPPPPLKTKKQKAKKKKNQQTCNPPPPPPKKKKKKKNKKTACEG